MLCITSDLLCCSHSLAPYQWGIFDPFAYSRNTVWQIEDIEVGIAGQSILNDALLEDRHRILTISVYWQSSDIPKFSFGKRTTLYSGSAPLHQIVAEEVAGEHQGPNQEQPEDVDSSANTLEEGGPRLVCVGQQELESRAVCAVQERNKMIVTVLASDEIRDELRDTVQGFVVDGISMAELDYQINLVQTEPGRGC